MFTFKEPSNEELAHDFLWRYHQHTPAYGMIHVFNRSHYEDVLVVRVKGLVDEERWRSRYDSINDFERMLNREGTTILKFFLHISKDAQLDRFHERLEREDKHCKFSANDVRERRNWDAYQEAYEDAPARRAPSGRLAHRPLRPQVVPQPRRGADGGRHAERDGPGVAGAGGGPGEVRRRGARSALEAVGERLERQLLADVEQQGGAGVVDRGDRVAPGRPVSRAASSRSAASRSL